MFEYDFSSGMGDTVTLKKKSKKKKKRPDLDAEVTCNDFKNTDENDCAEEKPRKKKKSKKYLSDSGVALETENDIDNTKETLKKKCKKKRKHEPDMADRDGSDSVSSGEIKPKKKKSKKSKRKEDDDNEDGYQLELPAKKKRKRKKTQEMDIVLENTDEITHSSKEKCKKKDKSVKMDQMESDEETINEENAIKKKKKKKKQKREEDEETPVEDSKCEEIQPKKKKKKKKHKQEEENNNHDDSIEKTSSIKNSEQRNSLLIGEASKENPMSYNCQPFDYGSVDKSGGDNSSNTSGPYLGQWGTASVGDNERQHKFMRLLGGFKKGGNLGQSKPGLFGKLGTKSAPSNAALNRAEEAVLNKNLESDFDKALALRLSKQKTSGLGFALPPEEGKKFYIDKTSSKSIKFDDSN
ncbi:uncharacterized protein DDB_G0283697-like [Haliotis rubra]|uniref:uncharacterized protein DDB_G0283697-like n=1 Tax=Haliotis rubra TaxID=36100 RepID=UPI001EE5C1D9|nr:uncharacterized protein DDB_G0283697-like [Haliotis rubra]